MSEIKSRYLKNLKYDKNLSKGLLAKYLLNPRLVLLLVVSILAMGLTSLATLPRTLNPEVNLTFVSVSTVLPGAGSEEVESLVTIPIEDAVESVDNLKTISSNSLDNVSIVTLEFESGTNPDDAKRDVQALVDSVNDLPENAQESKVNSFDFENQPVLVFSLASNTDTSSLITFSKRLKERLEDNPQIDRVTISGTEKQEVQILVNPETAIYYGVNPLTLSSKIKSSLSSFPAGVATTGQSNFPISIDKTINSVNDIRNMKLLLNGRLVRLSDIASVVERSMPGQLPSYIASNENEAEKAVVMAVYKTKKAKIDAVSTVAQEIITTELEGFNGNFRFDVSQDVSKDIGDQFGELSTNFIQTLILVSATLFVFLGIRQSLIVSLSIPLTFLISITAMNFAGLSLNFLSVFSLLLALGLLVDDAIVITSAMTSYMRTKKFKSFEAGLLVWRDFIVPIWSTTITTVWAFVPLLLSTGIVGEFIKTIPIVVSASLIASTAVAVLITLPANIQAFVAIVPKRIIRLSKLLFFTVLALLYTFLVPRNPFPLYVFGFISYLAFLLVTYDARAEFSKKLGSLKLFHLSKKYRRFFTDGFIDSERATNWYRERIERVIRSKSARFKTVGIVVVFSIFSYLLVPLGVVKNEFFPKIDNSLLFVSLELPSGTNFETTTKETLNILDDIRKDTNIKLALAEIGKAPQDTDIQAGENTALITLTLKEENSISVAKNLRDKYLDYSVGKISIIEQSGGPPVGSDVQIKLSGDDLEILNSKADEVVSYLTSSDKTLNVSKSVSPSVSKIVFVPDDAKVADLQLSNDQLGFWTRVYASGFTLDTAKIDGEDLDITYRVYDKRLSLDSLNKIQVATQRGYLPLSSLGKFKLVPNPTKITREDGKRTISVSAGVKESSDIPEVNAKLAEFADNLNLENGYSWETGGANEENNESVSSILQAMLLSAILILATMVIQLGSYRKSVIVLLVIPLAISGVFVSFALTNTPLSFPALIGVLALFGIVVNNSIVVVEKINQNLKAGIDFTESVADAAASRVEPIMFSSLTTIFGLVPITFSDPLWRGLGGAIISGLFVSGAVMLFFIPVVYYSWFKEDYKIN